MRQAARWIALASAGALAACGGAPEAERAAQPFDHLGITTQLIDDDLVQFFVEVSANATDQDISRYADCAAAQYALIRGFGFARHVRTTVQERGGVRRGDAVYTISRALPRGTRTIDAEVVLAQCAETGIPAV